MKKLIAGLTLALMVVALPLAMVGCKKAQKVEGTYKFETLTVEYAEDYEGEKMTQEQINSQIEHYRTEEFMPKIELNADNKGKFWVDCDDYDDIKWTKKGNTITFIRLDDDGNEMEDTMEATLKNGKLYMSFNMDEDGKAVMTYILSK